MTILLAHTRTTNLLLEQQYEYKGNMAPPVCVICSCCCKPQGPYPAALRHTIVISEGTAAVT